MEIEIRLFSLFREGRFKKRRMEFPDGTSLRDVIDHLNLTVEEVSLRLVNGRFSSLDHALVANDVLSLFPAVAGG